jgi:hypothetical protein
MGVDARFDFRENSEKVLADAINAAGLVSGVPVGLAGQDAAQAIVVPDAGRIAAQLVLELVGGPLGGNVLEVARARWRGVELE